VLNSRLVIETGFDYILRVCAFVFLVLSYHLDMRSYPNCVLLGRSEVDAE
jgi:hypothetical protein